VIGLRRGVGAGVLALLCCAPAKSPLIRIAREPAPAGTRLRLLPSPGARINARLRPALERPGYPTLRFGSNSLTDDSAYFSAPPELVLSGDPHGTIRASVCPEGERVCRMVELEVGDR
jgi:hypothetical protein